jgi:hypothetical protein
MPLILGTNSIKETGYDVANSCRFDDGSSDNIQRTYGTPTNSKIYALSWWVKLSTDPTVGAAGHDLWGERADKDNRVFMGLNGTGQFDFFEKSGGSSVLELKTNRLFRDVGAWYHFLLLGDSTQSTASNRIKLYINGVQETSFATETYPSQNYDFRLAINTTKYFARTGLGGSGLSTNYLEGYLAEVVFVDGTVTAHTDYGEFDEDSPNIWKPKDVSGLTFGNNGFYLDFENSSSLGADVSGNSNNFNVNNLTSIDQSTDTCTNNFCTMNPLYPDGTITFSEGNLKLTQGSSWRSAGGTMAVSTGKWYWEVSNVGNYAYIGFADIQLFNEGCSIRESFTTGSATTGRAHSVLNSDGRHYQVTSGGAQTSEYPSGATFSSFTNSTIGIALNLDDNNFIFYKDGTAMNPSGTPISITAGTYIPAVSIYGTNVSYNFGSPPYSISSGNSDANGHGNFEYSVPSGYYALNTKNLAEFG